MNTRENHKATEAFTAQSEVFDALYRPSLIVQYKRERVRLLLSRYLTKNSSVLELNAGTGDDAIWLAQQGHTVLATDASAGMIGRQQEKFAASEVSDKLRSRQLSFLDLAELEGEKFDVIFSNFGGLNCTDQLEKVLLDARQLLRPGGIICLTIMPPNCFWEWLSAFRGNFSLAFRRRKKGGTPAHVAGEWFTTYYYTPRFIRQHLQHFEHLTTEALCLAVPPEYLRHRIEKHLWLLKILQRKEQMIKSWPVLRNWGDYFVMVLRAPKT
jgi:ubiquinone/menaquinone biosynthesis C-methylase UbiE